MKDGVIDDPTRCQFNPEVMLCKGSQSNSCLTAPQIAGLNKIYGGLKDSKGKTIFPGLLPGGGTGIIGWESWVSGSAPGKSAMNDLAGQFLKTMVYEDQGWML